MPDFKIKFFVFILVFFISISFSTVPCANAQEGFLDQADTDAGSSGSASSKTEKASGGSAAAASAGSSSSAAEFPWQGRVTASSLNARTSPMGTIVSSFNRGQSVTVTGRSPQNSMWLLVNSSRGSLCVHGAYISRTGGAVQEADAPPAASASEFPFQGTVTASSLNARTAPWGTKSAVLRRNESVTVTGRSDQDANWYSITHSGRTLYCHSSYISRGGAPASGGSSGGSTGGGVPASNPNTGDLSRDILSSMASLEMRALDYPSPCGQTRNGRYYPGWLGCAYAVSRALNLAGVDAYSLGVDDLSNKLQRRPDPGFVRVQTSTRQPGDIVIWNPSHIGVIKGNGRCYSNSSSNGHVREHSDTYQQIRFVLRAPA
jgi:hypothetical protein